MRTGGAGVSMPLLKNNKQVQQLCEAGGGNGKFKYLENVDEEVAAVTTPPPVEKQRGGPQNPGPVNPKPRSPCKPQNPIGPNPQPLSTYTP